MTVRTILGGLLAAFLFACPVLAAAPTVTSVTETQFTSNPTAHAVDLPATVDAGDLLILTISFDNGTVTVSSGPAGWTELWEGKAGAGNPRCASYALDAAGTEDGGTATVTTSGGVNAAAQVHLIDNDSWYGEISEVEAGTLAGGTSANPDPPSITPTFSGDTLFIAQACARNDDATVSGYPSGYTDNQTGTISGGGTNDGATVGTATKEATAGAEDPGTFTLSESEDWVANTLVVRPAAGAGGGGTGRASVRRVVLDSGFGTDYDTDFDWTFDPELIFDITVPADAGDRNALAFTTLNGYDALQLTWKGGSPQATDDDRWGGNIVLPLLTGYANGYEEIWVTQDFQLVSNFSTPKGVKLIGIQPDAFPSSTGDCAGGWLQRHMFGRFSEDDSYTADRKGRTRYHSVDAVGDADNWAAGEVIPLDTLIRLEMYAKLNTAQDAADGILEDRLDTGTDRPTTLRQERTSFRMYCNSEGNRDGARVTQIRYHVIWGGNDSTWWPTTDSVIILGRLLVEIPDPVKASVTQMNKNRQVH